MVGAAFLPQVCGAADAPPAAIPPLFQPSISRVAVFKNGYAFTFRDGVVTPRNGWVATTDVPVGVLGTLWGYSLNPHTTVAELDATQTEEAGTRPVESLQDLLFQNEGAQVRITTTDKDKLEGTLRILTPHPQVSEDGVIPADTTNALNGNFSGGFQVVLKSDHGLDVVALDKIAHVEILGADPKWNKPSTITRRLLSMRLEG
ncbi:MAG: hypothetical protein M3Y56_12960, partial [Armatimonadota bacterium]|nr:hypothetical protein [Armatimonadota bacterium]